MDMLRFIDEQAKQKKQINRTSPNNLIMFKLSAKYFLLLGITYIFLIYFFDMKNI